MIIYTIYRILRKNFGIYWIFSRFLFLSEERYEYENITGKIRWLLEFSFRSLHFNFHVQTELILYQDTTQFELHYIFYYEKIDKAYFELKIFQFEMFNSNCRQADNPKAYNERADIRGAAAEKSN